MLSHDFADFGRDEYERRLGLLRERMATDGLDAVLIATDTNHRYFTGHWTHRWMHKFTSLFAVLPLKGEPVLVVPPLETGMCEWDSWIDDIRTYPASRALAGVACIASVLRGLGVEEGKIGAELGGILWMRMPFEDFGRLQDALPGAAFVDASSHLWAVRSRKSREEMVYVRRAVEITDEAYRALFSEVRPGMTERDIHRLMSVRQLELGAESPGSITVATHPGKDLRTCDRSHRRHSDRALTKGDLIILDAGCVHRGYWSDYTRIFALGEPQSPCRDAYRAIHECMHEAIARIEPGVPVADLVRAAAGRMRSLGYAEGADRMTGVGHASGLDIMEPPFLTLEDPGRLEEGMVFTVEPSMYTDFGFFMLEEDVFVTEDGYEMLSEPAPPELPIL